MYKMDPFPAMLYGCIYPQLFWKEIKNSIFMLCLSAKKETKVVVTYFATIWTENSFHKIVLESQQKEPNVYFSPLALFLGFLG